MSATAVPGTLDEEAVAPVREALAFLHDMPEKLVHAACSRDADDILSIVSCIQCAIGELRKIYDDRVDRFLDEFNEAYSTDNCGIRIALEQLADKTAAPKVEVTP